MKRVISCRNMGLSDKAVTDIKGEKNVMLEAGRAIYDSFDFTGYNNIAVVCGTGNNAGDGYVIASHLEASGKKPLLIISEDRFSDSGRYYFDNCVIRDIPYLFYEENRNISFDEYDLIIDCIFGTGFRGKPEGIYEEMIDKINSSDAYVISVDINSGLNGDSGMAEKCVESDITFSIGQYKCGHFLGMAKDYIGRLENCEIGIEPVEEPYYLIDDSFVRDVLPERMSFSNKSDYGYISLIGGSLRYSGAPRLSNLASSAMRSGAGVVILAIPQDLVPFIEPLILESTVYPMKSKKSEISFSKDNLDYLIKRSKAIGFGMGIGKSKGAKKSLAYLLENYTGKLLVDADGLTLLSELDRSVIVNRKCDLILTPHTGEASRLFGCKTEEILEDPVGYAVKYASDNSLTLLLKGPCTVITDGTRVYLSDRGSSGMASAGSGDVLSGIITALSGYVDNPLYAAAAGAYINGYAGEIAEKEYGKISMIASDTAKSVGKAINEIIKEKEDKSDTDRNVGSGKKHAGSSLR